MDKDAMEAKDHCHTLGDIMATESNDHGQTAQTSGDIMATEFNASVQSLAGKTATEKMGDHEQTEVTEAKETEHEYLEGFKLYLLMASISLVFFLLMLDMSIIVTVRGSHSTWLHTTSRPTDTDTQHRPYLGSPVISTPFLILDGMAAHIYWQCM